jgi:heme exporter protein C
MMYGVENATNLVAYWHIALAWTAGVALFVTFLGSVQYLRHRTRFWNLLAGGSAEIGFLMMAAATVMGSLWGKAVWGTYWEFTDVRMTTMFITLFVFAGYLVVFNSTLDSEGRYTATYGVVGFVTVPITYLSTRLWSAGLHDPTINPDGGSGGGFPFDPVAFGLSIVAITALYVVLVSLRLRILELRDLVISETALNEP